MLTFYTGLKAGGTALNVHRTGALVVAAVHATAAGDAVAVRRCAHPGL